MSGKSHRWNAEACHDDRKRPEMVLHNAAQVMSCRKCGLPKFAAEGMPCRGHR